MRRISTITTYEDIVDLARVYCVFKGIHIKDYVAGLIKRELGPFEKWLEENRRP